MLRQMAIAMMLMVLTGVAGCMTSSGTAQSPSQTTNDMSGGGGGGY